MTKTQYELDRDANVSRVRSHFLSLGIPILTQEVRYVLSNKEKSLPKTVVSDKQDSDIDYDPTSDVDNSDSDHDSDENNNDDVNKEVRCITWEINKFWSVYFNQVTHCWHLINLTLVSY
jgi:hypothetical protein